MGCKLVRSASMVWSEGAIFRVDLIGNVLAVDEVVMSAMFMMIDGTDIGNDDILADFKNIYQDLWDDIKSVYSNEVTFTHVRVQDQVTKELVGESAYGSPLVGTDAGAMTAQQATIPISLKTLIPKVILRKLIGPLGAAAIGARLRKSSLYRVI